MGSLIGLDDAVVLNGNESMQKQHDRSSNWEANTRMNSGYSDVPLKKDSRRSVSGAAGSQKTQNLEAVRGTERGRLGNETRATITPRKSVPIIPQKWLPITPITPLFERAIVYGP